MFKKISSTDLITKQIEYVNPNAIIFDVDGVLIDVRKSYNEAIKRTINFLTRDILNLNFNNLITDNIILKFRQTGGFNNDTDTSYAISLALLSNPTIRKKEIKKFLMEIAENSDETGIKSVERYLQRKLDGSFGYLKNNDKIRTYLNYPDSVGKSIVSTIFDEFFYGQKLFQKRYGFSSQYYFGKPLIENDRIVITNQTIKVLASKVNGKIAMVSGRSKASVSYSFNKEFKLLNYKKSVFLEDEKRRHAKPNPYGLIKVIEQMNVTATVIYCGDAIEDLIMTKRAQDKINKKRLKNKIRIIFCGVYGCGSNQKELVNTFKEKKADIIIKNINDLPNILNKVSKK